MYAGKSTLGRKLSTRLQMPFVDLDGAIEQHYHITVSDCFSRYGEKGFRLLEQATLRSLYIDPSKVIATGGGTPCFFENMAEMLENGIVIYLKTTPEAVEQRFLKSRKKRPLLKNLSDAERLNFIRTQLSQREYFYTQAHHTINLDNKSMDDIANELSNFLINHKKK